MEELKKTIEDGEESASGLHDEPGRGLSIAQMLELNVNETMDILRHEKKKYGDAAWKQGIENCAVMLRYYTKMFKLMRRV